jgi:predicted SAM-dependent methyltransferase
VVAAHAVLRFVSGRLLVHAGGPDRTWAGPPEAAGWLAAFARPADPTAVRAGLEAAAAPAFDAMVAALQRTGALVAAAEAREPGLPPDVVGAFVGPLADAVHRLAGDLEGLGAEGVARLAERTGQGVEARLLPLLAGATALEAELLPLRREHVDAQLARLGVDAGARGLQLHLGAGGHRLAGWINVDAAPAELALDLRWGLPFGDGAADRVFLSHMLEHLYYPEETQPVLREIRRVLRAGGRLRVIVPDVERCIRAYVDDDRGFFAARQETWTWWPEARTRLEGFLTYAGAGPRPSAFLDAHKFGFDYETLALALREAGFAHVERSEYMESPDPALRVDDASRVAGARHQGKSYSLFVEAVA